MEGLVRSCAGMSPLLDYRQSAAAAGVAMRRHLLLQVSAPCVCFVSCMHLPACILCVCMCMYLCALPYATQIGQALSSRPDVLPPEYIEELELLQVRVCACVVGGCI